MNSILAKSSENQLQGILSPKQSESVETAGSLAMGSNTSLFATNVYDMFTSSNPFSIDYSQYSESTDTVAYAGGFLSSFSSAVSTLSASGSFSDSGSFSSGACGGFSSASCDSSSGSFSSFC